MRTETVCIARIVFDIVVAQKGTGIKGKIRLERLETRGKLLRRWFPLFFGFPFPSICSSCVSVR